MKAVALIHVIVFATMYCGECIPLPHIPSQFAADLVVTSNQIDTQQTYPPRERHIKIVYDAVGGMAYAKIIKGYDAGKTYIRRYDLKKEYMVRSGKLSLIHI